MIDPMVFSSALLALVLTPMVGSGLVQQGQNTRTAQQPTEAEILRAIDRQEAADRQKGVNAIGGFNVVLVVGELEAPSKRSALQELHQGARRALDDMRDFLPYKQYRVLDSQWMSCCGVRFPATVRGRLEGLAAAANAATAPRPFTFAITVSSGHGTIPIRFALIPEDSGQASAVSSERLRELERERQDIQADIALLTSQIQHMQKRIEVGATSASDLPPLRNRRESLGRRLVDIGVAIEEAGVAAARPVIDSTFTMNAGETVVVGTSRLGGNKALIALITAVPKGTK